MLVVVADRCRDVSNFLGCVLRSSQGNRKCRYFPNQAQKLNTEGGRTVEGPDVKKINLLVLALFGANVTHPHWVVSPLSSAGR